MAEIQAMRAELLAAPDARNFQRKRRNANDAQQPDFSPRGHGQQWALGLKPLKPWRQNLDDQNGIVYRSQIHVHSIGRDYIRDYGGNFCPVR